MTDATGRMTTEELASVDAHALDVGAAREVATWMGNALASSVARPSFDVLVARIRKAGGDVRVIGRGDSAGGLAALLLCIGGSEEWVEVRNGRIRGMSVKLSPTSPAPADSIDAHAVDLMRARVAALAAARPLVAAVLTEIFTSIS